MLYKKKDLNLWENGCTVQEHMLEGNVSAAVLLKTEWCQWIPQEIRLSILLNLLDFLERKDRSELKFPNSFSAVQRSFVHIAARIFGLNTITVRKGCDKAVVVNLPADVVVRRPSPKLTLTWSSKCAMVQLLQYNPLTTKERLDLYPRPGGPSNADRVNREERQRGTTGRLMGAVPQIPPPAIPPSETRMDTQTRLIRDTRPSVCSYRSQILHSLEMNNVLVVIGPPGCGKSIHLPQMLLENCHSRSRKCRMICSQPRRLYAHINAECLAQLRGETVGQTVGYQIRLESKVSPKTLLTFCTHGVLLRTIYADPSLMAGTTHILIDEVEEDELPLQFFDELRRRIAPCDVNKSVTSKESVQPMHTKDECGILLGVLPSLLLQYPHLKIVFMVNLRKATADSWSMNAGIENHVKDCNKYSAGYPESNVSEYSQLKSEHILQDVQRKTGMAAPTSSCLNPANLGAVSQGGLFPLKFSTEFPLTKPDCQNFQQGAAELLVYENAALVNPHISSCLENAAVLTIPYNVMEAKVFHLEDILQWVGYGSTSVEEAGCVVARDSFWCQGLAHWLAGELSENQSATNSAVEPAAIYATIQNEQGGTHGAPLGSCINGVLRTLGSSEGLRGLGTPSAKAFSENDLSARVAVTTRQHANNLLWSIWNNTIFDASTQSGCASQRSESMDISTLITNLHQCILAGWFPVDYQHSESGLTALMVCSAAGLSDSVSRLLSLGADVYLRAPAPFEVLQSMVKNNAKLEIHGPKHRYVRIGDQKNTVIGINAFDLARLFGHYNVAVTLLAHMIANGMRHVQENYESVLFRFGAWFANPIDECPFNRCKLLDEEPRIFSEESKSEDLSVTRSYLNNQKLVAYHVARSTNTSECEVNFTLLMILLKKITSCLPEGSILVFLPSYEEIIALRERLLDPETSPFDQPCKQLVFVLHSRMLVADLTRIYVKPPADVRKIILASDIAESTQSFDDIAYVVDCGLNSFRTHVNWSEESVLRTQWISKVSAIQRQSRSTCICFRLYSKIRFDSLHCTRFIQLKGCQLEEACIQAYLLASPGSKIPVLLTYVPRPPKPEHYEAAIRSLIAMDALDQSHELTEIGYHICDLPIPPRYAKMVLVGVSLKCLDPILTIACILAYAEPFVTPKNALERREWTNVRKKFAADSYSDHMMLLRAFQFWQKARSEGWEKSYCQKNYISSAAFETITIIRTQLLGQLRASGFVKARGCGDIRDLNTNSENWAVVKAAIVSGMYPNFARVDKERERLERIACRTNESVHLHPHSVLAISNNGSPLRYSCLPSGWLVYDEHICVPNAKEHLVDATTLHGKKEELAAPSSSERPQSGADRQDLFHANFDGVSEKSTHTVIRCATIVSPVTIALIGGPMRLRSDILNEVENDAKDAQVWKNATQHPSGPIDALTELNSYDTTCPKCPRCLLRKTPSVSTGHVLSASNTTTAGRHSPVLESESDSDPEELLTLLLSVAKRKSEDSPNLCAQLSDSLQKTQKFVRKYGEPNSLADSKLYRSDPFYPLRLDDSGNLEFVLESTSARALIALRQKWQASLLRRLKNPGRPATPQDDAVLSAFVAVITSEEQILGLRQPSGVGARPRPMAAELCNQLESLTLRSNPNSKFPDDHGDLKFTVHSHDLSIKTQSATPSTIYTQANVDVALRVDGSCNVMLADHSQAGQSVSEDISHLPVLVTKQLVHDHLPNSAENSLVNLSNCYRSASPSLANSFTSTWTDGTSKVPSKGSNCFLPSHQRHVTIPDTVRQGLVPIHLPYEGAIRKALPSIGTTYAMDTHRASCSCNHFRSIVPDSMQPTAMEHLLLCDREETTINSVPESSLPHRMTSDERSVAETVHLMHSQSSMHETNVASANSALPIPHDGAIPDVPYSNIRSSDGLF